MHNNVFLNKYCLGKKVAMATSRGIDSAVVVLVCLLILSQTPTWNNTEGIAGSVLKNFTAFDSSKLLGSFLSVLLDWPNFSHLSFLSSWYFVCVFKSKGYFKVQVKWAENTNYGRPSALWFPSQANIGHAYTGLFVMVFVAHHWTKAPPIQTWASLPYLLTRHLRKFQAREHHMILKDGQNLNQTSFNLLV